MTAMKLGVHLPVAVRFEGRFYGIPRSRYRPETDPAGRRSAAGGRRVAVGDRARRTDRGRARPGDLRLDHDRRGRRHLPIGRRGRGPRPGLAADHAAGERQRHRRSAGRARPVARFARTGRRGSRAGCRVGCRARLLELHRRPAPAASAPGRAASQLTRPDAGVVGAGETRDPKDAGIIRADITGPASTELAFPRPPRCGCGRGEATRRRTA